MPLNLERTTRPNARVRREPAPEAANPQPTGIIANPHANRTHPRRRHRQGRHGRGAEGPDAVADRFGRPLEFEHLPWSADYYLESKVTIPPDGYDLPAGVRRDLHRGAWRSARARQSPCARHPARHALRARPLRQLPPRAAARRASLSAQGPRPGRRQLRRLPREHRGPVRRHRRALQGGHRR